MVVTFDEAGLELTELFSRDLPTNDHAQLRLLLADLSDTLNAWTDMIRITLDGYYVAALGAS